MNRSVGCGAFKVALTSKVDMLLQPASLFLVWRQVHDMTNDDTGLCPEMVACDESCAPGRALAGRVEL